MTRRTLRKTKPVNYAESRSTSKSPPPPPSPRSAESSPKPQRTAEYCDDVAAVMEANAAHPTWDTGIPEEAARRNPTYATSRSTEQSHSRRVYRSRNKDKTGNPVRDGKDLFTYDSGGESPKKNVQAPPPPPQPLRTRTPMHVEASLADVEGLDAPPTDEWIDTLVDQEGPVANFDPVQITSAVIAAAIQDCGAKPPLRIVGLRGSGVRVVDADNRAHTVGMAIVYRTIAEWVASVNAMKARVAQLEERDREREQREQERERRVQRLEDAIMSAPTSLPREEEGEAEVVRQRSRSRSRSRDRTLECRVCMNMFDTKKQLWKHISKVHRKGEERVCPVSGCNYSTYRTDHMQKHMARVHSNQ